MREREAGQAAAARALGGATLLWRERAHDAWGWRWLDDVLWDVRYAVRVLRTNPGFTVVAVLTLALGIGVNAAVFTVTNTVLFRGFPHVDPGSRLVYLDSRQDGRGCCVSYPDFEDWRAEARSFRGMALVSNGGLRLTVKDRAGAPEACDATQLSGNAFKVLGQQPTLGRDFSPADLAPGAAPVAILSYRFWTRRYSRDPTVIGRTIQVDDIPTTVIGVMGAGFYFPHSRIDVWLPIVPTEGVFFGASHSRDVLRERGRRAFWFAFGRLADGATPRTAGAELAAIGARLARAYPATNGGVVPVVRTFSEFYIGPNASVMYATMWGAVGFLLLIACANLANLLLGRAMDRAREISVRIALGAGRWRIVRQLLVESVILSLVGGALGWWVAVLGVRSYESVATPPTSYTRWDYAIDARVVLYVIAISVATGLLFGLVPALRLSGTDVNSRLKNGGRSAIGGRRGQHLSTLLVTGEMALAIVLLAGAGVMVRSFLTVRAADIGVDAGNVLTAAVALPPARYPDPAVQRAFFRELVARVEALPGVESVALATRLPTLPTPRVPYEVAGATPVDPLRRPTVLSLAIGPRYFDTLGASVLAGRSFSDADETAAAKVAIVSRQCARALWPGMDPVGKRLRLFTGSAPDAWLTVVGVASDIVQNDVTAQRFDPVVYVPFWQTPANGILIARTRVPPTAAASAVRHAIQALDGDLVIGSGLGSIEGPASLTQTLEFNAWNTRTNSGLFAIFAGFALLLASVGLYAVMAHAVSRRTQEIGIRTAMGATARDIAALVFGDGMAAVGIGLIIGLLGSLGLNQLLRAQLVRVSPSDPVALTIASGVLVVSAAVGCWIPARRAAHVDPIVALRHE